MKITEYPSISSFTDDNILLTDGAAGTKTIKVEDAVFAALDLISPEIHRKMFRGKQIGTSFGSEQKTAIQNGTFKDLWLGDYWTINGVNWRIVDIDYWYGMGNPVSNTHHLVIMPDASLYTEKMNDTSTTDGGYTGSKMYISGLTNAKSTITAAFGSAVLTRKEYLINAVTTGYPSAGAWVDSTVELPNEPMIYGSYIYAPSGNGTVDVKRYTCSKTQLALFSVLPRFMNDTSGYWLRDVVSATHFARVDNFGGATSTGGANTFGVRPVFAIG